MAKLQSILNTLLRALRQKALPNDTVATVASKLGVSASYLTKLENGDLAKPNEAATRKMIEVYELSEDWADALRGAVARAGEGFAPYDNHSPGYPSTIAIGSELMKTVRVKRFIRGPIPERILNNQNESETLITAPSLLMTFSSSYMWIHQAHAYDAFAKRLMTGEQFLVLPFGLRVFEELQDSPETECIDDIVLVRYAALLDKEFTADRNFVREWADEYMIAKAKVVEPERAVWMLAQCRDFYNVMCKNEQRRLEDLTSLFDQ